MGCERGDERLENGKGRLVLLLFVDDDDGNLDGTTGRRGMHRVSISSSGSSHPKGGCVISKEKTQCDTEESQDRQAGKMAKERVVLQNQTALGAVIW